MGYNTGTLDTNVLLRLILDDVPEQAERAKALIARRGTYLTVLDQAIAEAVYVLGGNDYGMSRGQIVMLLGAVLSEPRIDYDRELFSKVFPMYVARPKLSFADCYMAHKTQELDRAPLYTFDAKLIKQSSVAKAVPVVK